MRQQTKGSRNLWQRIKPRASPMEILWQIRWLGPLLVLILSVWLAWLAVWYLLSEQAAQFASRLALVTNLSTLVLVIITAVYVYLTARTLTHLREERLLAAEPLVYLSLSTVRLTPEEGLDLRLENFGKGPALRMRGEYETRSTLTEGKPLVRKVEELPDILKVDDTVQLTLEIPSDVTALLPTSGDEHRFLRVRLVYEDAQRNLYVYRLYLSLLAVEGRWYVQQNRELLWRISPRERYYIFDNSKSIVEHGRKPLFSRSLLGRATSTREL